MDAGKISLILSFTTIILTTTAESTNRAGSRDTFNSASADVPSTQEELRKSFDTTALLASINGGNTTDTNPFSSNKSSSFTSFVASNQLPKGSSVSHLHNSTDLSSTIQSHDKSGHVPTSSLKDMITHVLGLTYSSGETSGDSSGDTTPAESGSGEASGAVTQPIFIWTSDVTVPASTNTVYDDVTVTDSSGGSGGIDVTSPTENLVSLTEFTLGNNSPTEHHESSIDSTVGHTSPTENHDYTVGHTTSTEEHVSLTESTLAEISLADVSTLHGMTGAGSSARTTEPAETKQPSDSLSTTTEVTRDMVTQAVTGTSGSPLSTKKETTTNRRPRTDNTGESTTPFSIISSSAFVGENVQSTVSDVTSPVTSSNTVHTSGSAVRATASQSPEVASGKPNKDDDTTSTPLGVTTVAHSTTGIAYGTGVSGEASSPETGTTPHATMTPSHQTTTDNDPVTSASVCDIPVNEGVAVLQVLQIKLKDFISRRSDFKQSIAAALSGYCGNTGTCEKTDIRTSDIILVREQEDENNVEVTLYVGISTTENTFCAALSRQHLETAVHKTADQIQSTFGFQVLPRAVTAASDETPVWAVVALAVGLAVVGACLAVLMYYFVARWRKHPKARDQFFPLDGYEGLETGSSVSTASRLSAVSTTTTLVNFTLPENEASTPSEYGRVNPGYEEEKTRF